MIFIEHLTQFRKWIKVGVHLKFVGTFNDHTPVETAYDFMNGKIVEVIERNDRVFFIAYQEFFLRVPFPWGIGFKSEKGLNRCRISLYRPGHCRGKNLVFEVLE